MDEITKEMLKEAQQHCDENDKSTEFMIVYMQDFAGVDHDTVIDYLMTDSESR